ncbi:unnamed protein product, partial [marine sediment metagenome]
FDSNYLQEDRIEIPVQINGKLRGLISAPLNIQMEDLLDLAQKDDKIAKYLLDKEIKKKIYVPKKMLNLVVI